MQRVCLSAEQRPYQIKTQQPEPLGVAGVTAIATLLSYSKCSTWYVGTLRLKKQECFVCLFVFCLTFTFSACGQAVVSGVVPSPPPPVRAFSFYRA